MEWNGRTEEGEEVGVVFEIEKFRGGDESVCEPSDGGLDGALGLDDWDGQGGDKGKGAEDDKGGECRGEHAGGDLGMPVVEDVLCVVGLSELEVVVEAATADYVQCGDGCPVCKVDDDGWLGGIGGIGGIGDMGSELGLESGCDGPDGVVHVADIVKRKGRGYDGPHPSVL